jgi:MFS family permease
VSASAPEGRAAPPAALADSAAPAGHRDGAPTGLPWSPVLRLYPALAVRPYRLLWLGMLPGTLAWQMSVVATGYAALTVSGSAATLGLVSGAVGLPMLLLSLVGGVVADRLPRRIVLLMTQATLCVAAAVLTVLMAAGWLQVWHLIALGLVQGMAFSFNMPARQAYIAELVGQPLLRSAVALNNAGVNFCRIAGPALGGALLALPFVGIGGVFATMTLMYLVVIGTLLALPQSTAAAPAPPGAGTSGRDQLLEGLRYLRGSPALLALLGMAFITIFFGMPYQQLMPVFSERVFLVGAAGLGVLMAASGVGSLAGSLAVAGLAGARQPALLQLGLGIGFGLALVAFALAPVYPLAVALLVVVGFTSSAYTTLNSTLIMSNTEPRLYGRVMSVYLLTFAVMPLAAVPMGWLAEQVGGRATVAGSGTLVALAVLAIALGYPAYRRIR